MIRNYPRTTVAALVVSAAGFAGIAMHEDYVRDAMIPVTPLVQSRKTMA